MNKKRMIVSGIVLVCLILVVAFAALYPRFSSIAVVNGKRISKAQFYKVVESKAGRDSLNELIAETLIRQAAEKNGIYVTKEEIDKNINDLRAQFGQYNPEYAKEGGFERAIKDVYGLTMDVLREQMELSLLADKLTKKDLAPTEEDLKAYFDENRSLFDEPEQVKVRHILVEDKSEAESIAEALKKGADFAVLAKAKSIDTQSGQNGGDLGYITRGIMVEEFEDAAFSLEVGEISKPVKSSYGYHIIKVDDRKQAKEAVFEESKEKVREEYLKAKAKPIGTLLQELMDSANIVILRDEYKDILDSF